MSHNGLRTTSIWNRNLYYGPQMQMSYSANSGIEPALYMVPVNLTNKLNPNHRDIWTLTLTWFLDLLVGRLLDPQIGSGFDPKSAHLYANDVLILNGPVEADELLPQHRVHGLLVPHRVLLHHRLHVKVRRQFGQDVLRQLVHHLLEQQRQQR